MKRKITGGALSRLGITGDVDPDEWLLSRDVVDVSHERGSVKVVFKFEDRFWLLEVSHHPEDWSGTNDLREWAEGDEHLFEIVEVEQVTKVVWQEKKPS